MLDLRPVDLHDLEQGDATPTALLAYRLAAALQVSVPMLGDPKASPLAVLRLLASGPAVAGGVGPGCLRGPPRTLRRPSGRLRGLGAVVTAGSTSVGHPEVSTPGRGERR